MKNVMLLLTAFCICFVMSSCEKIEKEPPVISEFKINGTSMDATGEVALTAAMNDELAITFVTSDNVELRHAAIDFAPRPQTTYNLSSQKLEGEEDDVSLNVTMNQLLANYELVIETGEDLVLTLYVTDVNNNRLEKNIRVTLE